MLDVSAPRCEAWISPELIQLYQGIAARVPKAAALADRPLDEAQPFAVSQKSPPAQGEPVLAEPCRQSPEVVLRVDGRRPVRFHGLLVCETERQLRYDNGSDDVLVVQSVKLFLSDRDEVFAQAISAPVGNLGMRPVYRVASVSSADDINKIVDETGPMGCLTMVAAFSPAAMNLYPDAVTRLPGLALQ